MIIAKNKLGKIFPISIVSCNFWPKENQNLAYISINLLFVFFYCSSMFKIDKPKRTILIQNTGVEYSLLCYFRPFSPTK